MREWEAHEDQGWNASWGSLRGKVRKKQRETNGSQGRASWCWFFASVQSFVEVTPRRTPGCSDYLSALFLQLSTGETRSPTVTSSHRAPHPPSWWLSGNKHDPSFCFSLDKCDPQISKAFAVLNIPGGVWQSERREIKQIQKRARQDTQNVYLSRLQTRKEVHT